MTIAVGLDHSALALENGIETSGGHHILEALLSRSTSRISTLDGRTPSPDPEWDAIKAENRRKNESTIAI